MKFTYPVESGPTRISQFFGPSVIDYSKFGLKGHNGIDFWGVEGDRVLAVADGLVVHIGYEADGYGHYILIQHGDNIAVYAHLRKVLVKLGDHVTKGSQIAEMGNSGNSTGPHLHFGIRPRVFNLSDGYLGYIDPLPFFQSHAFSNTEQIGKVELSRIKVLHDGVAIRSYPGFNAPILRRGNKGDILLAADTKKTANNLSWRLCFLPVYIAETDGVKSLIEEIKDSGAQ